MLRRVSVFLMLMCLALPIWAETPATNPPQPMGLALDAMQNGRWDRAAHLAKRAGAAGEDLIEWHRLRAGHGTATEVLDFLDSHPDWPGLEYLRKQSEDVFANATRAQILKFYGGGGPQTGTSALLYAKSLSDAGQKGDAEAELVLAWHTMDLTAKEHNTFVARHGDLLKPHHPARLQMTLWRGLKDTKLMLPLVSETDRAVAEVWQMAKDGKRGLDAKISLLPEDRRKAPGIAFARFNRLLERSKHEDAIALMQAQSRIVDGLGEPSRWAGWRRSLARRMMRAEEYQTAYDLAAHHQLSSGSAYADLEWLSGYLALRFMNDPALALDHFQRLRAAVKSPISLGRAGYWIGRAQEAAGDDEGAAFAYAQAAQYQTSFYGLLAAERAGLNPNANLSGQEEFPRWQDAAFTKTSVFQAGILALHANRVSLAERFFLALADTQDRPGLGQMAAMLIDMEQPHLQVMLGKRAARRQIVLPAAYYALHPMTELDLPVPMEMALAIARRESEFDFRVSSGAGAEGLMQLMPGTASDVARDLGVVHKRSRVLSDWKYNAKLGSTYLAQLSEKFDGNVILMSAGYNAGPHRSTKWMERFGDPRNGGMDIIDWIEHIPFRETRNYVQRVAESLPVYRARLGRDPLPIPFSKELIGATILSNLPATD